MITMNLEELAAILETFAHEIGDESGEILRDDWRVVECLEIVNSITKRSSGLAEKLRKQASLFCLTYEDVFRRPLSE